MSATDLVFIVLVAAGAFYAGYQVGRLKALSERAPAPRTGDDQPLPGPDLGRPISEGSSARPRAAAPPASADDGYGQTGDASSSRPPVRSSRKPPPAAAGLMGTGNPETGGGER